MSPVGASDTGTPHGNAHRNRELLPVGLQLPRTVTTEPSSSPLVGDGTPKLTEQPATSHPLDEGTRRQQLLDNLLRKLQNKRLEPPSDTRSTEEETTMTDGSDTSEHAKMHDGSDITETSGTRSNTRSMRAKGAGRWRKNLKRAKTFYEKTTGCEGWTAAENPMVKTLQAELALFHPTKSVPQGLSALGTYSKLVQAEMAVSKGPCHAWSRTACACLVAKPQIRCTC